MYNATIPPEYFDVIVIDECHRSIYSLWRQVLEYFDAYHIGLTATPAKHTFGFFNQNLVMEYGHAEAVADNVNVDFEVYKIRTLITEQGSMIEAEPGTAVPIRDRRTRQLRWDQPDEDLTYTASELDRAVVAQDQIRMIVRTFKDRLFTDGMTWVFYDSHATGSLKDKWIVEVRLDGNELRVEQAWAVLSVFSRESLVKPNPITSLLVERVVAAELARPDSKAVMDLRRSVQQRFGERVSGEAVLSAIRQVFLAPATAVEARVEDELGKDFEPPIVYAPRSRSTPGEAEGPPRPRREPSTESFTKRRVIAFTLRGARHEVRNWRGLLRGIRDIASAEVGIARFQDLMIPIRGSRHDYFATDSKELHSPLPIQGGTMFVEGNLSANAIVGLVHRTLAATLGDNVGLAIETAPPSGAG